MKAAIRALLRPKTGIAVVSTLLVALVAVVDARRTSPGPLTQVHGSLPELQGRSGCVECHGGWATSMTDSCLACHETIRTHMVLGEGLHGSLEPREAERCGRCHSDHHGEGFVVVNLSSFREAGVHDPEEFDHDAIGWHMDGAHLELSCAECHVNADAGVLPAGEHRFLGTDRDCATCHEDSHEGRMQLACAQCHGQSAFTELFSLGHEELLPLVGGHGDVSCRECHASESPSSLENLGERVGGRPEVRECRVCHEDPHASQFVDGVARMVDLAPGASCVTCHVEEHETFRASDLSVSPQHHAASGFALAEPHADLECGDCHDPFASAFEARFPGRGADECSTCHDDPHGGQFAQGPFSGGDCIACHERTHFEPHAFDVEDHARATLPLDGAHVELDCQACHQAPSTLAPRRFRGTASDCDACHADAHTGFFAPHARELGAAQHGLCAACHGTDAFEHELDAFQHDVHADFLLDGAHEQASCESCHPRASERDELGRSFGRVGDRFGLVEGCADCHDDPHAGEFDAPGLPRTVEGRMGCARCHTTSSFRALREGWDHRRWTGFALEGAHGAADCAACHAPLTPADEHGRTWKPAAGARCADCHADPHAAQFETRGATSCERCHESSESWSTLDFNHDRDSRFPLGASHSAVSCDACHVPAETVRYRPMDMGCVDCHGTLDGPAMRRRVK